MGGAGCSAARDFATLLSLALFSLSLFSFRRITSDELELHEDLEHKGQKGDTRKPPGPGLGATDERDGTAAAEEEKAILLRWEKKAIAYVAPQEWRGRLSEKKNRWGSSTCQLQAGCVIGKTNGNDRGLYGWEKAEHAEVRKLWRGSGEA